MIDARDYAENRPIRTVPVSMLRPLMSDAHGVVFCAAENDRGPFEVLVCPAQARLLDNVDSRLPGSIEGYFRRRSGYRPDGRRRFIWTLIPTRDHLCAVDLAA